MYENGDIEADLGIPTAGDPKILVSKTSYVLQIINMGLVVQSLFL